MIDYSTMRELMKICHDNAATLTLTAEPGTLVATLTFPEKSRLKAQVIRIDFWGLADLQFDAQRSSIITQQFKEALWQSRQ
jgi:hypothetical protein